MYIIYEYTGTFFKIKLKLMILILYINVENNNFSNGHFYFSHFAANWLAI